MKRILMILFCGFQLSVFGQKVDTLQSKDGSIVVYLDELEVIDSQDNDNPTNQNTDQFLHQLSGVAMMRRGNFANEPMLRGMTSDRTITTIDGMRIFGACTDKMDPVSAYVEPINLNNLEVQFGGTPSMLGNTTGGSMNFQLKKPIFNQDQPIMGSVGMNYGSVAHSFDQLADMNFSGSKVAARFSGVHRKAQNYTNGNDEEVRYSQYEKINYAASLSYRLKNDLINLDFIGDDGFDIGYPALPMDVSTAKAKLFSVTYLADQIGFLQSPELKIYHNYINHVMDDTKRDGVAIHMDMPGKTRTTGGYIAGKINENFDVKLEAFRNFAHAIMIMYADESDTEGMYMETWPDIYRNLAGAEVKYRKSFKSFSLNSGGRLEVSQSGIMSDFGERQISVFSKSDDNTIKLTYSLSAGIERQWNSRSNTTLNLSSASRLPTTTEQFGFYLFNRLDGFDYIGDPDIKNERSYQIDIKHQVQQNRHSYSFSLFSYYFENYIMGIYDPSLSSMTIGARGVKWYSNTGNALMLGGEIAFAAQITNLTKIDYQASFVYGADFEGDPLPQIPPFKNIIAIKQMLAGFTITPQWEFSAQQNRNSKKFYEIKTASYHLFNLDLARSINLSSTSLELKCGVQNIFDQAYREHFDIGSILRPGRQFYFNLNYKF